MDALAAQPGDLGIVARVLNLIQLAEEGQVTEVDASGLDWREIVTGTDELCTPVGVGYLLQQLLPSVTTDTVFEPAQNDSLGFEELVDVFLDARLPVDDSQAF